MGASSGDRVRTGVGLVEQTLADLGEAPLWSMSAGETRDALRAVSAASSRLAELESRLLTHAAGVEAHAESGARSLAAWLGHTTRVTRREAHASTRLAATLEAHPATREALARGEIRVEQARVICTAVEDLCTDLDRHRADDPAAVSDADLPTRAEKHLLAAAEHHDAKALRILGRRILEVADPAGAEAHEARALAREERRAEARTRFTMADDGRGLTHGRFAIPTHQAVMLRKALLATAAPRHQRATHGAGTWRFEKPGPQKLGEAFGEYVARYPADKLPHAGGVCATVVVTMTLETLLGGLQTARLDTGEPISPGQARRLAREAGLVPAVLSTRSQVLDLGRRTRFFTEPQHLARLVERATCEHPTCDTPAALCHGHHRTPWSRGGSTDKAALQWLCPRHHALAHQKPDPPRRT